MVIFVVRKYIRMGPRRVFHFFGAKLLYIQLSVSVCQICGNLIYSAAICDRPMINITHPRRRGGQFTI